MQELKYNEPWIMQRADPYIYKHESGMYYFTASVPAYDKIILRESDTLEGLADATEHEIWHKHDTGIMGNHIWAPELHYLNQKWYIYLLFPPLLASKYRSLSSRLQTKETAFQR